MPVRIAQTYEHDRPLKPIILLPDETFAVRYQREVLYEDATEPMFIGRLLIVHCHEKDRQADLLDLASPENLTFDLHGAQNYWEVKRTLLAMPSLQETALEEKLKGPSLLMAFGYRLNTRWYALIEHKPMLA